MTPSRSARAVTWRLSVGCVVWELLRTGMGMSLMPEILRDHTDSVERMRDTIPHMAFPVWLVTHRELHTSRRIRVVFDVLANALRRV